MKLNEHSQNVMLRVTTIQIAAFVMLAVLGARLYYLQVVKGDYYAERAENQRIRHIPIPAPRGVIFDRNGKILVDSRPTYNVTLSNEPIKKIDVTSRVDDYAKGLNLEKGFVVERLNLIKKQNEFETMVLKENATMQDITWVESHSLEFPELRIELQPQRFYPHGTQLAHILGYVGEISPKQLESDEWKDKGLKAGDIIGKGGLPTRVGFTAAVALGLLGCLQLYTSSAAFVPVVMWVAVAWWFVAFLWVCLAPARVNALGAALAGLLALVPCWLALVYVTVSTQSTHWVLFTLALVWAADTGAFFAGRTLGRVPLAPRVSPKKTWEGVIGGVVLSGLVATEQLAGFLGLKQSGRRNRL